MGLVATPATLNSILRDLERRLRILENTNLVAGGSSSSGPITASSVTATGGLAGASLVIGSGTAITDFVVYVPSLTPSSVGANSTSAQTFTVVGLTTADKVLVNGPAITAGVVPVHVRVSAADTLQIVFANLTAGALTPASGTYTVLAIRS
jgi:hypothetical protein